MHRVWQAMPTGAQEDVIRLLATMLQQHSQVVDAGGEEVGDE
jgi:6-phosphogluconate dehydrogenase (decarboxylating)